MMRRRIHRTRRASAGVTLLELMVTLAVVSIGILGVTSMNFQSARAVQDAAEIALATNLGTAALDEIQVQDYNALALGTAPGFPVFFDKYGRSLPTETSSYFQVTALVQAFNVADGFKDVVVQVSWKDSKVGGGSVNSTGLRTVEVRGRVRQLAAGL